MKDTDLGFSKTKESALLASIRSNQKQIENFVLYNIITKIFDITLLKTKHFREWVRFPMNYCRIMELPLTLELLELQGKDQSILDISSPKLLALYLAANNYNIIASDLDDYFVKDFEIFERKFATKLQTSCFSATDMPYQNESFDRIFSISVFEHIPDSGDIEAIKEVSRVLKPGGVFVMTLPAYKIYLEEWVNNANFYWRVKTRDDGSVFYQRRYTETDIRGRFSDLGLTIEDIIWICEKPIKEPCVSNSGMLYHNVKYLEEIPYVRITKKIASLIPLVPYFLYSSLSQKTHYLSTSFGDENIRQVAVKFRKS